LQGSLASLAASLAASTDSYDLFSVAERAKYFGVSARHAFMSRYALASSNIHSLDSKAGDDDDAEAWVGEGGRSPRQDYLRRLARRNLLPWPAMMRRPNNPHSIDITGLGMGDAIVVHLAAVLERLPHVSTISVRNNRLTDVALLPLVQAVTHMPGITALDISENKMDDSAHEMLHYLGKPDCALRKLTLIASDIDDWECGSLCEALKVNKSLTDLNLSKNLIGRAEELNIVQPDLITGGEAIAEMLEVNDKITSLDLSWNFIRHESAQAIGKVRRRRRRRSAAPRPSRPR
jgi:Leucine-rich repeat (LRR) protein